MRRHFVIAASIAILAGMVLGQDGDLLKELEDAFKQGAALRNQSKFAEAIPHMDKALALAPKVFGPDHINTASITNASAFVYSAAGRSREAETLYQRSLALHERVLPKNDPKVAIVLSSLSSVQDDLGKYAEAETAVKRALAIQEAQDPREDLEIALTVNNYAALLYRTGRYEDAEPLFKRCLDLREVKLGKEHPDVAHALGNLAGLYRVMRRDKEAETFARRALDIRVAKFGPDHPAVSQSLMELGVIALNAGHSHKAEKFFLDANRIREKHFGKDDPGNATGLHNLALVYQGTDRAAESEALFLRSLAMREARFGPDHPQVANGLSNLATLYSTLGRYDEAEKMLRRSIKIWESKAADHPEHASALNNLAALYQQEKRYPDALSMYQRALTINESRLGKNHIEVAVNLSNLAVLHTWLNRPADGIPFLQRALKIQNDHFGPDHLNTSPTYMNMATAYWRMGEHAKSDELMERCIKLLRGKGGVHQNFLAAALHNRAELNQAMNRTAESLKFMNESMTLRQDELRDVFSFSSESAMYAYAELTGGRLDSVVNMAHQSKNDPAAATQAFEWTLRFKGAVLDTLCRYRQAQLLLPKDDALQERVARYRNQKEFLANLALSPPTGKDAQRVKKQMEEAELEVAGLEKELTQAVTQKIPGLGAERDAITVARMRERLSADGALLEFMRISTRDFKQPAWTTTHYFAFVLTPGSAAPRLIDLGPAKEIDTRIEALRKEFTEFQEKLKDCESPEEVQALEKTQEKQFAARSAALHVLLFEPLHKELGKAKLLYLATDGGLNRLPFEALVGPDGKYLIEHYRCAYLSCGRDLLRTPAKMAKGTIVFANPDFKLDAEERLAQAEKLLDKKPTLALRGSTSRELRSVGWKSLPGAAAEAKDIQQLLHKGSYGPVKAYVGAEAIEEVLKAMPAPRVLHLATHGFFLDRAPDTKAPAEEGAGAGWTRSRLKRMDNPLLRSGIVLAGANTIGDKDAVASVEDGWVTAEEIALLNLQGTELVVLSACQTGLGDIKSGEGVHGLRRAFLYAGAQTLVTSLFEVPDTETRELMSRFYTGFNTGQGKLRALHSAQRGFIDERRKTQGAAHPFFWASFVLVGNPD